jgi:hypothetical protein
VNNNIKGGGLKSEALRRQFIAAATIGVSMSKMLVVCLHVHYK